MSHQYCGIAVVGRRVEHLKCPVAVVAPLSEQVLFSGVVAPGRLRSAAWIRVGAATPRRTVLDKLLVDAASEAGAEVREGFTVADVAFEDGRATGIRGRSKGGPVVSERARVVIGADGHHSLVARRVRPEQYN